MRRRIAIAFLLCHVCLPLGPFVACARAQQPSEIRHDGQWWLSISTSQRSGFLNGYFDCYTYQYKGPNGFTQRPPAIARDLVTKFYQENPSRLNDLVSDVFDSLQDRAGEKGIRTGGEPMTGPHGYYDGLYWRQIWALGGRLEQTGFAEGYLWCQTHLSRNKSGVFSKSPAEYVALITQWYGFDETTGDVDGKREPAAIADVLFMFRDQ